MCLLHLTSLGMVPRPPHRCYSLNLLPSSVPRCPWAYFSHRQRRFSILGDPILGKSVSNLLGELLYEELAMRWEQLLLDDAFTGGALAWLPGRTPRIRQLVYPAGGALDKLCILSCWAGSQPAPSSGGGALGMVQGKGKELGGSQ